MQPSLLQQLSASTSGRMLERSLKNIEILEPDLQCLLDRDAEAARRRWQELSELGDREREAMPLFGVPVVVKDNICIEGQRMTCASKMLESFVSPYSATVWQRLEEAGAVLVGKSNLDEFAMGSSTENSAFFVTRNPWDTSRVPGGSSGGSAAAVAADYAPLALGSDTGGSIRQPAAYCGVTGLKPTYGRVSRYGLAAFASSLDQVGPIARSAVDAALGLSVIGGYDPLDSTSSERELPAGLRDLDAVAEQAPVTLAVPRSVLDLLDPEAAGSFEAAVAQFRQQGHTIIEVELPYLKEALSAYYVIAPAEASSNMARYDGLRYGPALTEEEFECAADRTAAVRSMAFGPEVKRRIMLGTYTLSAGYYDAYYHRAQKVRTALREAFEKALKGAAALVTPTAPGPAFPIGERTEDPVSMYLADVFTVSANLTGLPALSLPGGFLNGLPVGVQLTGPAFSELELLLLGRDFQRATDYHTRRSELIAQRAEPLVSAAASVPAE